jgi:hypothetical protein
LVEGTPFSDSGNGYIWAHTQGVVPHSVVAIDSTVHSLAEHPLATDESGEATRAAGKGLFAIEACEQCYRNHMRELWALVLAACGGLSGRTFETESVSWILYTQPRLLMGGRAAEVVRFVAIDQATGCDYPWGALRQERDVECIPYLS